MNSISGINISYEIVIISIDLGASKSGGKLGDDCGPCSNPFLNFDCGECDSSQGLKCLAPEVLSFDISPKCNFPILPIASARIQGPTGTLSVMFFL